MNPSVLKGKKVIGTEGYVLGEVDGLDIDASNWKANVLCVSLGDEATAELGFRKPFLRKITVCLPTQLIRTVGDVITLNGPIRNLADIAERATQIKTTRIEGRRVVGAKGDLVGEVEGFEVDFDNWQVTGLQVGLTDDAAKKLGFKNPVLSKVIVVIPSNVVGLIGNFITLNETVDNLESLVECIRSCQKQK